MKLLRLFLGQLRLASGLIMPLAATLSSLDRRLQSLLEVVAHDSGAAPSAPVSAGFAASG